MSNRLYVCVLASLAMSCGCSSSGSDPDCTAGNTRCSEGVLEHCSADGEWVEDVCDGICVEVNNVGFCQKQDACTAGTTRCNDAVLEICDGTKWNSTMCDGTCVTANGAAFCQKADACTAGAKRCNNGAFEECDGTGWKAVACDGTCVESGDSAFCQKADACTAGAKRCHDGALEECDGTDWKAVTCDGTCVESGDSATCEKTEVCTAGKKRCSEGALQECDGADWKAVSCDGTCVEAFGSAFCQVEEACTAGAKRCNGAALEICDGVKWNPESCAGTCVESSGTAVCQTGECTKGDIQCSDDGTKAELWTCGDDSHWVKTPCPASDIEGARLSCLNAVSCSTVLCGEGSVYQSDTKKCETLAHSNQCVEGRTYCNGKTNYLYQCLSTGNEAPTAATDCAKDGMVCVSLSQDEARCVVEQCKADFCEGETLVFCTPDHQLETQGATRVNCAESDRICALNEEGVGECMYPECTVENEIRCVDGDDTHTKYQQCINKRWSDIQTCADGVLCETINKKGYCAECHDGDVKCEEVSGTATKFTCSDHYAWQETACPSNKPVCDADHKDCTETPDDCGNGTVGAGEDCDGTHMGKADGLSGDEACKLATGDKNAAGTISCNGKNDAKACHFNVSNCQYCGNGVVESGIGEACEVGAAITKSCGDVLKNSTGTLKCGAGCQFDTSDCKASYSSIGAIYEDYDKYVVVKGDLNCSDNKSAPKAEVDITGVVTAIRPDKLGFYIQSCESGDSTGIYVYTEYSVNMPKDIEVGKSYRIQGGLVSSYHCGLQIKKGDKWTITAVNNACSVTPQSMKLTDILDAPTGDLLGSLVKVSGVNAIDYRNFGSVSDNTALNVPGGEVGWRIGKPGIGSEMTVGSGLTEVGEKAMTAGTAYNITGIVMNVDSHLSIAPRTMDDIAVSTCKANCNNDAIYACVDDKLETKSVSCAKYLEFDGAHGKAVCASTKDDCRVVCDAGYVLVAGKCVAGYLETFDFEGESELSATVQSTPYKTASFKSSSTGLTWNYSNARNALCSVAPIDGNGLMLKTGGELSTTVSGGVSTITLQADKATTGSNERTISVVVESVTDSSKQVKCPAFSVMYNGVMNMPVCNVNISGDVKITVKLTGDQTNIDNIQWMSL